MQRDTADGDDDLQHSSNSSTGGYGIYSKVCRIAKKASDASVIFAVLALIRRDPSFGMDSTAHILERYKAPISQIDPARLTALLPLLFQGKYEPTTAIRDIMKTLWKTLIGPDRETELLASLQNEIIKHLGDSLANRNWKDREAAVLALEAFLPQRSWRVVRCHAESLWTCGLRVLDDIRNSTRMAAIGFMKVLSDHVIRACNPVESSAAVVADAVAMILPLLLDKGLEASSPECRGFTIGILLKIVQVAQVV